MAEELNIESLMTAFEEIAPRFQIDVTRTPENLLARMVIQDRYKYTHTNHLFRLFCEGARRTHQPAESAGQLTDEARHVAAQMVNVLFNLAQRAGHTLTSDDCALFDKLRKEWDAVRAVRAQADGVVITQKELAEQLEKAFMQGAERGTLLAIERLNAEGRLLNATQAAQNTAKAGD
jgi:hypothetical protein